MSSENLFIRKGEKLHSSDKEQLFKKDKTTKVAIVLDSEIPKLSFWGQEWDKDTSYHQHWRSYPIQQQQQKDTEFEK